jgi:hypothetical protein
LSGDAGYGQENIAHDKQQMFAANNELKSVVVTNSMKQQEGPTLGFQKQKQVEKNVEGISNP